MTMRRRANWSLGLLTIAFLLILVLRHYIGVSWWLNALLFIVEAGMVGALADWFAVTALFRHPLGLKFIPHTAIIPKNKNQLIEGVVKLVEEQLLDRQLISQKLEKMSIVRTVINQLGRHPIEKITDIELKRLIVKISTALLSTQNMARLESTLETFIFKTNLSKWLGRAIQLTLKNKWDHTLLNKLLDLLYKRMSKKDVLDSIKSLLKETTLSASETNFFTRLLFKAAEAINAVNIDDAAEIIYRDLLQLIKEMKDDQHPVRMLLTAHLQLLATELEQRDDLNAVLQVWLSNMVKELKLQTWLPSWLQQFFQLVNENETTKTVQLLTRLFKKWINAVWLWFINHEAAQEKVESYIKNFLSYLLQYEYKLIGEVVKTTLSQFTDERLVEFIESKVETDLQRIRLNGALIGACVGAIIYIVLYGVYEPLLSLF